MGFEGLGGMCLQFDSRNHVLPGGLASPEHQQHANTLSLSTPRCVYSDSRWSICCHSGAKDAPQPSRTGAATGSPYSSCLCAMGLGLAIARKHRPRKSTTVCTALHGTALSAFCASCAFCPLHATPGGRGGGGRNFSSVALPPVKTVSSDRAEGRVFLFFR